MEIKYNFFGKCTQCRQGPCRKGSEKCDGLEDDLIAIGSGVSTDWYPETVAGTSGDIRFEIAADEEFSNKKAIDDAVELENRYGSSSGKSARKNLPPCKARKYTSNG